MNAKEFLVASFLLVVVPLAGLAQAPSVTPPVQVGKYDSTPIEVEGLKRRVEDLESDVRVLIRVLNAMIADAVERHVLEHEAPAK